MKTIRLAFIAVCIVLFVVSLLPAQTVKKQSKTGDIFMWQVPSTFRVKAVIDANNVVLREQYWGPMGRNKVRPVAYADIVLTGIDTSELVDGQVMKFSRHFMRYGVGKFGTRSLARVRLISEKDEARLKANIGKNWKKEAATIKAEYLEREADKIKAKLVKRKPGT